MTKRFLKTAWIVFLVGSVLLNGAMAAEQREEHHPEAGQGASAAATQAGAPGQTMPGMMEMMGQGMMDTRPCMYPSAPSARLHMMSEALSGRMSMDPGMMRHMMNQEFFLDRVDELELSADQVEKLRTIRSACRKENIRTGAEAKIVRLDLDDLLARDDWTIEAAEQLVRKQQKLEGDMLVRHLQALADARQVLTLDQLQKTRNTDLDKLFR